MLQRKLSVLKSNALILGALLVFAAFTSAVIASRAHATSPSANATSNTSPVVKWEKLSADQKAALAPLAGEWDSMDSLRQKKWLGIADKYAIMKPEEQKRVQERVAAWVKLTPEQRMMARENFTNTAKKTPEQKSAQWQQYQQLSAEEKQKLANEAKVKKSVTTIQPESKRTGAVIEPLKKVPASKVEAAAVSQPTVSKQ